MRRRRERRDEARERKLDELRGQSEAVNIVVWSDAEGDEGREGEKEAFEALQVCISPRSISLCLTEVRRQYEPDSDSDDSDSDDDLPVGRRGGDSDEEEDDEGSPGSGKRQRVDKQVCRSLGLLRLVPLTNAFRSREDYQNYSGGDTERG